MEQPLPLLGPDSTPSWQHVDAEEYHAFLRGFHRHAHSVAIDLRRRAQFVQAYPDLRAWFAAPLTERVGRLHGEHPRCPSYRASYRGRSYLYYLALRGRIRFDWAWLVAVPRLHIWHLLTHAGLDADLARLIEEAATLGYRADTARAALSWTIIRLFLHTPNAGTGHLRDALRQELVETVEHFGERDDIAALYGSPARYRQFRRHFRSRLHLLHVVLYHRGQSPVEPHKVVPSHAEYPVLQPRMEAVMERYLAVRRLTDRPATIERLAVAARSFIAWIAAAHPEMESFADVTRPQVLDYALSLDAAIVPRTGLPLAAATKVRYLSGLSVFFRDVSAWAWEDAPAHALLVVGDLPKLPLRVPRYVPDDELARLMAAVRALSCPYQRAALLIARWSGARKDEIRRLPVDCLDAYPDGTPRLRLPAGKTKRERIVPLNEEAAEAIQAVHALRRGERGFRDTHTGVETRYLFMNHGKLYSGHYLFDYPLHDACQAAGLVTADGKPTVSAHRLRHTVGTQLAERGAKLHTIMTVLGHTSPTMTMVYAQISDREVLKDYQAVLGPGATIAGPAAAILRSGDVPASAVEWLRSNFFKTELELGHCLRLPQEGPCECDLYLTCAKFVTTPEYAPRLRERRQRERELIDDALSHGWMREVERHRCTVTRIERLLQDLGEPSELPETRV